MPAEGLGWDLSGLGHILCVGHSSIVVFRMRVSMLWAGPGSPSPARAGWSQQQQSRACTIPVPAVAAWIWWVWGQWPEEHKVPAQGYQELEVSAPQGHSAGTCRACHGPCSSLKHPWCSPSHRQGCSREAILSETDTIAFGFHQNVGFLLFTIAPRSETEVALEAQTWLCTTKPHPSRRPHGAASSAGTTSSARKHPC